MTQEAAASTSANKSSKLTATVADVSRYLKDGACGPLIAAKLVMAVVEKWDKYKAEAGDMAPGTWLEANFGKGKGMGFFERRAEAVDKLGEHSRRTWHHDAAVWAVQNVPEHLLKQVDTEVQKQRLANGRGHTPLTLMQVRAVAKKATGLSFARDPKACSRCARLEKALRDAGVPVPTE